MPHSHIHTHPHKQTHACPNTHVHTTHACPLSYVHTHTCWLIITHVHGHTHTCKYAAGAQCPGSLGVKDTRPWWGESLLSPLCPLQLLSRLLHPLDQQRPPGFSPLLGQPDHKGAPRGCSGVVCPGGPQLGRMET